MRKRLIILAALAGVLTAKGQSPDSVYQKKKLPRTDVQVLFSFYDQDGNHSAVTGGTGTEQLNVFGAEAVISKSVKGRHVFKADFGADYITSASTDRINSKLSSASKKDMRGFINLSHKKTLHDPRFAIEAGSGFSMESDFISVPAGLTLYYSHPEKTRDWSLSLQTYFDDLRWGRLKQTGKFFNPITLVYPEELRYRSWYNEWTRQSFNLRFALSQVINKRVTLSVFPEAIYQQGLLATSFHRVYFTDTTLRVENLPSHRWKLPLGMQLNSFLGSRTILKTYYRFYADNWGILSHTASIQSGFKLSSRFTIGPTLRFYIQTACNYFRPYKEHTLDETFYTSDYDLSAFHSWMPGLLLRVIPIEKEMHRFSFRELNFLYGYYHRSDGLWYHVMTLQFDFTGEKGNRN